VSGICINPTPAAAGEDDPRMPHHGLPGERTRASTKIRWPGGNRSRGVVPDTADARSRGGSEIMAPSRPRYQHDENFCKVILLESGEHGRIRFDSMPANRPAGSRGRSRCGRRLVTECARLELQPYCKVEPRAVPREPGLPGPRRVWLIRQKPQTMGRSAVGSAKFGWLKMLKNSGRNGH